MIQKAYTETSIGQCHYRFHKGEGTPIVFLHQTPSSSLMYQEIIQLMPQNTCIAIDTPGFGMSDDISGNPNVADYGKSIVEALNNINISDFHLLGHHSGASIALHMENEFNHMVSSLTLIGAFLATKEEKELMKNQTGLDWSPKEDGTHLLNAWKLAGDILGADENLDLRQRETLDAIRAEASAKQMHHAVWGFDEIEALKKTKTPCLILCSEDDVMYPFLNKANTCRSDAIVEIIQGKNLEPDLDAKNISNLLMEFLKKI